MIGAAMMSQGEQALIAGLDDEQRAAVLAGRGPVCVLAGAGTGKTRTITHRIAHLVGTGHVAAGQVLAVTFTQRAAGEMRSRLRGLDAAAQTGAGVGSVQALTFHSAARRQLRYFWPRVVGGAGWPLLDSKFAVVAQAAGRAENPGRHRRRPGPCRRNRVGQGLTGHPGAVPGRGRPGRPRHPAGRRAGWPPSTPATRASRPARKGPLLDFDDLLLHTAAAIENDAAVAEEFRDRYRCFVVDEYQDVTPLQQRVLDGVARRARRPDRGRRRQPDHLLVHRRHAAATCWTSRGGSPRPPWCGWNATTGRRRRWCRWPTGSSRRRGAGSPAVGCT